MVAAAVLSQRYISDRFLPDKAIDLVDEAAAKLRTEIDSMPADLDEATRRQMQLEIERDAEALPQCEAPRAVHAHTERRVHDQLHAARLVEEALEDQLYHDVGIQ